MVEADKLQPDLRPIIEPEVQKVAAAIRQSMDNQRIMRMLLERVKVSFLLLDGAVADSVDD